SVLGAELPVDLTYTYTPRSQIASINDQTVANIDQTFTYDGIGRLTASTGPWGNGVFQYDGLGNLRQRQVGSRTVALSYDANNRLSSHTDTAGSPRSLTYDARGNVTALGPMSFTYNTSDQPTWIGGSGITDTTHLYDGHMRRVRSASSGVTRYSVYDASGSLIEIDEVGGAKTDYIRASGMTLARIAGSTVTWLHHDHLGSAVAGTNSAGTVVWRESEQPFGEDWQSAAANDNQAGYTGHVEDAATGLTYMQARYYDPVIGRFLSIDPVGFSPARPDMFNRYAYAGNDPVNMIDPDGAEHCAVICTMRGGPIPLATSDGDVYGSYNHEGAVLGTGLVTSAYAGYAGTIAVTGCVAGGCLGMAAAALPQRVSAAYKIAAEGGKHAGFLRNYSSKSIRELERGIKNISKEISSHYSKIKNPEKYVSEWGKRSDQYKKGVVEKWKKDIARQKEQRDILKDIKKLKESELSYELPDSDIGNQKLARFRR
ncbi:MAG TPA: RHS repeat-associated core domain-containing protein, partial [Hyphomonas sp.]|nr:RHS repeat-associated core domain-containing protein [Hyphomonas sp.]